MDVFLLYIDPGSGSYLIQALVAAALGVLYFFKNLRLYITAFLGRLFSRKPKDPNTPPS